MRKSSTAWRMRITEYVFSQPWQHPNYAGRQKHAVGMDMRVESLEVVE